MRADVLKEMQPILEEATMVVVVTPERHGVFFDTEDAAITRQDLLDTMVTAMIAAARSAGNVFGARDPKHHAAAIEAALLRFGERVPELDQPPGDGSFVRMEDA